MNRCSGCGYIVPAAWTECRRCGAALAAAPSHAPRVPVRSGSLNGLSLLPPPPSGPARASAATHSRFEADFGATDDVLLPGAAAAPRPRPTGPDTMLPYIEPVIIRAPVRRKSGIRGRTVVVAVIAFAAAVAAVYPLLPRGGHGASNQPPTILAARPPAAGIPTSLSEVVRIAAESSRHTALVAVISTTSALDEPVTLTQLDAAQPDYEWVPGTQPSTTNKVISITSSPTGDVIAVSGTSRDICAFGRWSQAAGESYVTMAHLSQCAAANAPATGWSSQAGGSAQDLPGPDGR